MAKDKLTEYSATNASNDVIGDISVAEGMLPSAVNNALREQMTHLKNFSDGADAIDALAVDNLKLDGNTISSTDTNGDITIDPDGTGDTIVASGKLGVGTASPSRTLDVHSGSDAAPINIRTTQALSLITFDNSSDTSGNHLVGFQGDDFVVGDTNISLRLLSAGGICFGSDTAAANALDDYEEGTFTAGLAAGSGTITANTGHDLLSYIKIGNLVFISGLLIVGTFSGASNSLYITGLPFGTTAGSENSKLAAMSVAMQNLTSDTGVSLQAHVLADERILVEGFDGQTYNNIADHCGVGTQVRIGGSYYTG